MEALFQTELLWCGTEASYTEFLAANKHFLASHVSAPAADMGGEVRDTPRLFSQHGEIGVITIAGSLTNTDSWVNEFLGRSSYPEIREALVHAASKPGVKEILLDIKSGGGQVYGLSDTADLVSTIDTKVKPVHAYSDSIMASAAYWLGSSARSVNISKSAEVGSIGVLVVHQENSKMLADEGITTTVIRSGKFKALGLSAEKLSALGQEVIQEQVDKASEAFTEHVAKARGTTAALVEKNMGQGRMFSGQSAVDAGLVDGVTTFDALLSKIGRGIDSQKQPPKYGANFAKGTQVKHALTEQAIAAMAAGGNLTADAVAALQEAAALQAAADLAAGAAKPTEGVKPTGEQPEGATGEAPAEPPAASGAAPVAADLVAANAKVDLLTGQLSAANASVVEAQIKLRDAQAALAPATAALDKMRPVVQASVSNLRVALGMSAAGVDALNDEALLAEQAGLSKQFTDKFKVGGLAAVSPGKSDDKGHASEQTDLQRARLAATRNTSK